MRALADCRLLFQEYPQFWGTLSPELPTALAPADLLRLSWSKMQELIRIEEPWKRASFEHECLRGNWSVRQLRRQIETLLFERTGLSTDKLAVIERARRQTRKTPAESIAELIREPYVQEFTGLTERSAYSKHESDIALFDKLQCFVPRHSRESGNPERRK